MNPNSYTNSRLTVEIGQVNKLVFKVKGNG